MGHDTVFLNSWQNSFPFASSMIAKSQPLPRWTHFARAVFQSFSPTSPIKYLLSSGSSLAAFAWHLSRSEEEHFQRRAKCLAIPLCQTFIVQNARLPCAPPQQANVKKALTAVLSFWLDLDNFLLGKLYDRPTLSLANVNNSQIESLCQNLQIFYAFLIL